MNLSNTKKIVASITSKLSSIMALLIVSLIVAVIIPEAFLTSSNMINIVRQMSTNGILTIGMTIVLISGGIDLSVGSVLAVSGVISCGLVADGVNVWVAVILALLTGPVFGIFNGFFVAKLNIPPFIVTLASMQIGRGIAYVYSSGLPIRSSNETYNLIGNGYLSFGLFEVPIPIIILIIVVVISYLLLHKTKFGNYVFAVGGNSEAARYSGISVAKTTFLCYVYSGTLSALVGIILASRMYSGQPTAGEGYEMDAVAAAVLGGTSFSGGVGNIIGVLFGALTIGVINNALNLLNIPFYFQDIVKGSVILIAVLLDTLKKRGKGK